MHPFLDFTSLQINKLATDASVLVADMPYQIVGTYSLQTLVFIAWNATAYRVKRIIVNSAAHGSVSYAQKDL